jgi:hypothetical protein
VPGLTPPARSSRESCRPDEPGCNFYAPSSNTGPVEARTHRLCFFDTSKIIRPPRDSRDGQGRGRGSVPCPKPPRAVPTPGEAYIAGGYPVPEVEGDKMTSFILGRVRARTMARTNSKNRRGRGNRPGAAEGAEGPVAPRGGLSRSGPMGQCAKSASGNGAGARQFILCPLITVGKVIEQARSCYRRNPDLTVGG